MASDRADRSAPRRGLVGRVLGDRYRVTNLVSAGANTLVADADDLALGRAVTIKLVRPEWAESPAFRRAFDRDMRAIAALSHPNLAAVYDWGEEVVGKRTTVYTVVEHLSGGSLRDILDRGRSLDPSQALLVGLEACRGLDFAHRQGHVHTELTPSKLVFGDDRRLRIVDFGLARLLGAEGWSEPATLATHVARYASPEQAMEQPLSGKTDVYSLALILIESVTRSVPFAARSTVATLSARVGRLMPVSADLGPLASVLERAGRPEPSERATAAELGRGLVAVANKLRRPAPIPILVSRVDEDPQSLRRPTDPTGGIARPPAEPLPAVVAPVAPPTPEPEVYPEDEDDAEPATPPPAIEPAPEPEPSVTPEPAPEPEPEPSVAPEPAPEPEPAATRSTDTEPPVEPDVETSVVEPEPSAESESAFQSESEPAPIEAEPATTEPATTEPPVEPPAEPRVDVPPPVLPLDAEPAPVESAAPHAAPPPPPPPSGPSGRAEASGPSSRSSPQPPTSRAAEPASPTPPGPPAPADEATPAAAPEASAAASALGGALRQPAPNADLATLVVASTPSTPSTDTDGGRSSRLYDGDVDVTKDELAKLATAPPEAPVVPPVVAAPPTTPRAAPARRSGRRRWLTVLFAFLLLAALAGLALLAMVLFRTPTHPVPDVTGETLAEAEARIAEFDWDVEVISERSDEQPDEGAIIRTEPVAGKDLGEGEPFLIVVSDGPEFRTLPDLTSMRIAEAETELARLRLTALTPTEVFDEEVPAGSVVSWSVPDDATLTAGSDVLPGTEVALVVSKGPEPRVVPDFAGMTAEQATEVLAADRLEIDVADAVFSDSVPSGEIVSSDPAAGTEVERDSVVVVVPSKGVDLVALPDLSRMTWPQARQALAQAGLEVGSVIGNSQGRFALAMSQDRELDPGDQLRRGTAVDLAFV